MTRDDIVEILNDKVKEFDDDFKAYRIKADLVLKSKDTGLLAEFEDFQPFAFYLEPTLTDELEWEITDGSNKFDKFMEVTKLFYAEAKPLLEDYWDE